MSKRPTWEPSKARALDVIWGAKACETKNDSGVASSKREFKRESESTLGPEGRHGSPQNGPVRWEYTPTGVYKRL